MNTNTSIGISTKWILIRLKSETLKGLLDHSQTWLICVFTWGWGLFYRVEFLKDRMISGGIIYFDDYNSEHWPGATQAIDEMLGKNSLIKLEGYQAYWIKK